MTSSSRPERRPNSHSGGARAFFARVTAATALGEGLDGYDLGTISVVLPLIESDLHTSSLEEGLLAASSLIGIFIGGPIFGWIADRVGRRKLFVFDLVAFIAFGGLQIVAHSFVVLFALRICLGLAIGAEYAVGETMLAELVPNRGRGLRLSSLQATWYGGYLLAVVVAYILKGLGVDWGVILATGAVPGVATLILRHGLPESPRWLASIGRRRQAREIVETYLDDEEEIEELLDTGDGDAEHEPLGTGALFGPDMWRTTLFASLFFMCVVTPYFAIFTLAPEVFSSLGFHDPKVSVIATNAVAFLGALVGMFVIERFGRRRLLLVSFAVMIVTIAIVGAWVHGPTVLILACFVGFAFFNAIGGDLCGVYPAEVFPGELRGSGVGFAAAMSRVGAAGGTFLLPIGISSFGIGPSLLIGAGICVLGLLVTWWLAPETTGQTLGEFADEAPDPSSSEPAAA